MLAYVSMSLCYVSTEYVTVQLGGWLVLLHGVSQNVTAVSGEPIAFVFVYGHFPYT